MRRLVRLAWVLAAALSLVRAEGHFDITMADALVIEQTNQFRRFEGARDTTRNQQLTEAARYFADYMARTDRYGHEADGTQPSQRAMAQGYAYCLVSENIAYQFSSAGFTTAELARRFVEGWKQSPGHRRNMLDPDATETGVGIAQSPRSGRYYAVQMFGRPQSLRVVFRIANRSPMAVNYELGGESFRLPPRTTRTHEQCHADALTVRLPGEPEPMTVQPGNGERYAVERVGARYRLSKS
jgi:hypothetical protein